MDEAEKAIQELTKEAKTLLRRSLGCDEYSAIDRFIGRAVDCIIMTSALTVAKWQSESINKLK